MVVELVDKATNELLIQTDWTTVLQISDILNRDPSHARSVVKQITKKLKDRSRVIMLALELADSLLQNCECTHVYFAERTFQTELCRLIMNKKTKLNVKEKTLEIVESWGNAFSARHDLQGFYETYSFIKRSGYKFPPKSNDAPILNFNNPPQKRTVSSSSIHPTSNPAQNNYNTSSPQRSSTMISSNGGNSSAPGPIKNQEISSIKGSTSVFNEMISFLNVEEEDPLENELVKELFETCKQSQQRVKEMIESGSASENDLNILLKLNDEINNALKDYDACLARRKAFVDNGFKPLSPPPQNGHNFNSNNSNNLASNNKPSYLTKHKELEEIDFFKAPDGVSSFSIQQQLQPYQQPIQQQQPVYNTNFNPFAPQQQQPQPQQFNFPQQQPQQPQQPQQQLQPKDDFDLFVANRQQHNPFANMNNNINNGSIQPYVPSTAKSLPASESLFFNNNKPNMANNNNSNANSNGNTNTLPSAPPPFRPNSTQSQNSNPFSSPYNSPMYNNNNNTANNNIQPNNSLVPSNYPNYNAIRNDNDMFGRNNNMNMNNGNNNFNQNPYGQQQQMPYNPNSNYGMMNNNGFSPNYPQFSNYVQPNNNIPNQNGMMNQNNNNSSYSMPQTNMYPNTGAKQSLI
ncbi:hypothetical protein DICPUDRAFT_95247 [Dictyostelium purpureum]|uniref:VHS domain-containing protein n=1 Tax=Dictyostelium purpureum TaxID=5786 RepID=F0ZU05_DICPU|nr:uncharacterized protein DICPUDRAFT_95247 [Dictyostelium purpureum]EGC32572.1 hypothetical protein DICPUDRAFT_95247 [Dictyostelium purpureum]|eukprot:XP_003290909.1 hypothetical protein DICPUDRAFT_95247 [Dictyostelium purpureum]